MCKIDATVNFFSAVAGNFTVKTKRKSNLESYNFILCFATSNSIQFNSIFNSISIYSINFIQQNLQTYTTRI